MKTFSADGIDIRIESGAWQIIDSIDSVLPLVHYEMKYGSGVMQYTGSYAAASGLPGTQLSTSHVQAVVVGFQAQESRWLLGLHVSPDFESKPKWMQLVAWQRSPNTRHATEAQESGRILAEYIGCPLKIFGVKKMPTSRDTGPLERHTRNDIDAETVSIRAARMTYPGTHRDMKFEDGRAGGYHIRIGRDAISDAREAPAYHHIEIDPRKAAIKLIPPTGLLGGLFTGPRGREIGFKQIRNVELRHVIIYDSKVVKSDDSIDSRQGLMTEELTAHNEWRIYLTVPNESILLASTIHNSDSELSRQRAQAKSQTNKLDFHDNVDYYRRLTEEQEAIDAAKTWSERAAYLIASAIGCRLVETQVGDALG